MAGKVDQWPASRYTPALILERDQPIGRPLPAPLSARLPDGGMNHDQFKKCVGQTLRLEPPAIGPDGRPTDDAWEVVGVDDELAERVPCRQTTQPYPPRPAVRR